MNQKSIYTFKFRFKFEKKSSIVAVSGTSPFDMLEARLFAASVVVKEDTELFVTGGRGTSPSALSKTTEFVSADGSRKYGPELPIATAIHCLVKLNGGSSVMLIGGWNTIESCSKSSWTNQIGTEDWTAGPDLLIGRRGLQCGVIVSSSGGEHVVVAGGYNNGVLDSTEILKIGDPEGWRQGKNYTHYVNTYCLLIIFSNNI